MTNTQQTETNVNRTRLKDMAVLKIEGLDARDFLQNLITNDMEKVTPDQGIFAFLLSAQGKYQHAFHIFAEERTFCLITDKERIGDLNRKLTMLKLRAKVQVSLCDDIKVHVVWPIENTTGNFARKGALLCDGRAENLAAFVLTNADADPQTPSVDKDQEVYYSYLAERGIQTPHRDFLVDKTTMMEAGLDGQHAVSWTKGCFVGQELTARVKYRGLVKRLLVPTSQTLAATTKLYKDGALIGTQQSSRFALVKRDAIEFGVESGISTENGDPVSLIEPAWWPHSEAV